MQIFKTNNADINAVWLVIVEGELETLSPCTPATTVKNRQLATLYVIVDAENTALLSFLVSLLTMFPTTEM